MYKLLNTVNCHTCKLYWRMFFFGRKHHFNTSLFNTPGVHQGWEKPMQLEYANYIQLQTIFPQGFTDIVGLASIDSYGNNVV